MKADYVESEPFFNIEFMCLIPGTSAFKDLMPKSADFYKIYRDGSKLGNINGIDIFSEQLRIEIFHRVADLCGEIYTGW